MVGVAGWKVLAGWLAWRGVPPAVDKRRIPQTVICTCQMYVPALQLPSWRSRAGRTGAAPPRPTATRPPLEGDCPWVGPCKPEWKWKWKWKWTPGQVAKPVLARPRSPGIRLGEAGLTLPNDGERDRWDLVLSDLFESWKRMAKPDLLVGTSRYGTVLWRQRIPFRQHVHQTVCISRMS